MTIAARMPYSAPEPPVEYKSTWFRTQLTRLSQALLPQVTRHVIAATTITIQDDTIVCDATAGAFAVTLLPADQVQFLKISIKRINGGGNAITITGTVDGSVNPTLGSQWSSITIQSDGTRWLKLASV